MTRRKQPASFLDEEFQHWHVLGPILWVALVYAAAIVLHLLGDAVPARYVGAVGGCASVLAPLVAIYKRFSFLLMAGTTGLLTYVTATSPWHRGPALAAAAGAIIFGMSYQALRKREAKEADTDKAAEKAASRGRYVELLEQIGAKGLKEKTRVPFAAGKTIILLLPVNGSLTLRRLKDLTEQLEIAAARAGLEVTFEFEKGATAAEVKLHVFERDILAETLPLEFDRGPKSVNEPIPLGQYATGEICTITFREIAALMVGLKGKGKSGLINTHLAHLTGCTDAVVWMLDGKGGETVRPWLQPFLDLVTERPVIDWAAVTEAEFDAVLLAANAVRKYRSKLPGKTGPTAAMPSVIVIVEEASVITGVGRYGGSNRVQLAQDGVTLGRSSYLDWLFATQRAVLDMVGSGSMKANLDARFGLGVSDAMDARSIFPDGQMAQGLFKLADDNKYRGTFLMQAPGSSRVMPAKGYWVEPKTIPGIAETNARWTAELDRGTAEFVHTALLDAGVPGGYQGRWKRFSDTLGIETPQGVSSVPASQPETRPSDTAETSQYDGSKGRQVVQDAIAAGRAKRDDDTFQQLVDANFETVELGDDDTRLRDVSSIPEGVPPILRYMLTIFRAHGQPDDLPSQVIVNDLPGKITVHALGRLMGHCNVSPGQNIVWEGKRARGYTRDAVETAVKRGSWSGPAFDWEP
jgi:hypothetical protein